MLLRPMSRALFVGALGLALASAPDPAPADVYLETAYLPTSSIFGLSSTVLPTSYVVPTSYSTTYLPTSYVSTSSVIASDSVVYPTSTTYIRRSILRPRRFVEQTYTSYPLATASYLSPTTYVMPTSYLSSSSLLPTTYLSSSSLLPTTYVTSSSLLPTTYLSRYSIAPTSYLMDSGVVTTSLSSSSYPCETESLPARTVPTRATKDATNDQAGAIVSKPGNGAATEERRPQGRVNGEEGTPSNVVPPVTVPPAKPDVPTPPNPQGMEEQKPEDMKLPPPGESGGAAPKTGETVNRSSFRPNYDRRNILRGRVISAETRRPEEGVTVIVSNVTKNFTDRPAMTDAFGEFNVSLPDGDWAVKVKMPSGTVYSVGRDFVTASNGRVTDSSGRNVTEFVITR